MAKISHPKKRRSQKNQGQEAIKSFLDGDPDKALAILKGFEKDGMNAPVNYALMAMIHLSTNEKDKCYYALGRLCEIENFKDLSEAFYNEIMKIYPDSETAKKLKDKGSSK